MSIQQFSVLSTFATGLTLGFGGENKNDDARNGPPEYPIEGIPIPDPKITSRFLQTGLFKDFAKKTPEE